MTNIKELAQEYLTDTQNQQDYHAFALDKDELILSRVVFSWARAQGHDGPTARLLSMYIVELAHQNVS